MHYFGLAGYLYPRGPHFTSLCKRLKLSFKMMEQNPFTKQVELQTLLGPKLGTLFRSSQFDSLTPHIIGYFIT